MFQTVADYIARLSVQSPRRSSAIPNAHSMIDVSAGGLNVEKLWSGLIEKFKELGRDQRIETRKAVVHTLENIFTIHGASIKLSTWHHLISGVLLNMLAESSDHFVEARGGVIQKKNLVPDIALPTPSFFGSKFGSKPKQMKFDDDALQKMNKNDQSADMWEESCSLLVLATVRGFKKFNSLFPYTEK